MPGMRPVKKKSTRNLESIAMFRIAVCRRQDFGMNVLSCFIISLFVCCVLSNATELGGSESKRQLSSGNKFTSFQCIGGSQVLDAKSMVQASVTVFPLNDAAHRTCLFKNICAVNGKLTYYSQYEPGSVTNDYLPEGFGGNIFHVAYLRAFTLPVHTVQGSIPADFPFSETDLTFLDANSWSFNYGHYLIDNTIPNFMAAKIFNLPFEGAQQLFENNCRLFSTLEPAFAERIVTYNRSMGTYRQACLAKLDGMYAHFYDKAPLYLDMDNMQSKSMCFSKLMVGQGSTFGLKSIDLSRGYFLREFRDYVLKRLVKRNPSIVLPPQENLVLVGLRTVGAAGGKVINELCDATKDALKGDARFNQKFKVECFVPSDLTFEDEIRQVQRAKVIVSVHGTISYMSLFAKDGTQQISIANPKELKENQILLYATHFHTLYLTWDKLKNLPGVLHHSLTLSDQYYSA
jgi:hypothetical protein